MKVIIKTCPICGKEFQWSNEHRKYCSSDCAAVAERRQNAEVQKRSKNKRRTKNKMKSVKTGNLKQKIDQARALGISYGKLQAMRYLEKQREENPILNGH